MAKLTSTPSGSEFSEKAMRHKEMNMFARLLLEPMLNLVHPALVLSISFFVGGLLVQLWALALSSSHHTILLFTSILGTFFSALVALLICSTVWHALWYEDSPFGGQMTSSVRFWLRWKKHASQRWTETEKLEHYCELVSSADDPALLDRAAPLVYNWAPHNDPDIHHLVLKATHRVLASDTTHSAKLTVAAHMKDLALRVREHFRDGSGLAIWRRLRGRTSSQEFQQNVANVIDLLGNLYRSALKVGEDYRKKYFVAMYYLSTALAPGEDREHTYIDPSFEYCVGKALCLFGGHKTSVDHDVLFQTAVEECYAVLNKHGSQAFDPISVEIDRPRFFQHLLYRSLWPGDELVSRLVKGHEDEVWETLAPAISSLTDSVLLEKHSHVFTLLNMMRASMDDDGITRRETLDLSNLATFLLASTTSPFLVQDRRARLQTLVFFIPFHTIGTVRAPHAFHRVLNELQGMPELNAQERAVCEAASEFLASKFCLYFIAIPALIVCFLLLQPSSPKTPWHQKNVVSLVVSRIAPSIRFVALRFSLP
ncbi:hypothetical protein SISSUDRAFT_88047 [Sistotremastrum suecicum HHB10207 ss-3]|uniref:DUF6535 domain-containing protein n=1 Tax=Sistotremastrum suecicum HHB10207 ss-3 TaxID=1314776 RepID=A0A166BBZ1_9AGAM|nr:hypothetical protein SISSUDRAFT_88047 [Sistotremastrum suecicum HHB10207 ss-3]